MTDYTRLDFNRIALITIDTQCDTLDGEPLEIPGTSDVLPNMQALLQEFRVLERPIVHIVRIYKKDGSNVDLCRRSAVENGARMLLEGRPGCELAPSLLPDSSIRLDHTELLEGNIQSIGPKEVIIYKPRWGAFFNTPLYTYLKEQNINSIIFSGCNFPNCPRTSIYEASERDFRIALAQDAVSGLYPRGKTELENIGVRVEDTASLLENFHA